MCEGDDGREGFTTAVDVLGDVVDVLSESGFVGVDTGPEGDGEGREVGAAGGSVELALTCP